jgi:hypothetical protein
MIVGMTERSGLTVTAMASGARKDGIYFDVLPRRSLMVVSAWGARTNAAALDRMSCGDAC